MGVHVCVGVGRYEWGCMCGCGVRGVSGGACMCGCGVRGVSGGACMCGCGVRGMSGGVCVGVGRWSGGVVCGEV